ncbi:TonB-dependent receptor [Steroidobacter agaridevorans]|uniref:TonB-dependent receptor n=1 Tax=Steroidobacter agaridevorans TaxID=2695856 RepID=UPI00137A2E1C|nr:TonB-dependent receptor [Steroidobacter agaridevorans]
MKTITGMLLTSTAVCLTSPTYAQKLPAEHGPDRASPGIFEAATQPPSSLSSEPKTTGVMRIASTSTTESDSQSGTSNAKRAADDARRRGSLEEVIVTAQKRSERIQDVPVSITAITAEQIDERGLAASADYLRGIPSVNQVEQGYGGQAVIIRGMETSLGFANFSSGSTVATYFGEIPTTNSAGLLGSGADLKLVDVDRVEVLRGPQGTAFGSSSMGGAVRIIPSAPQLTDFSARVAASYSVTSGNSADNHNAQAFANIPIVKDRFAIRATAYQYQDSGYYRNEARSNAAYYATLSPGAQPFAVDQKEVGETYVLGGRIATLFQATEALGITLSYLKQKSETDGYAVANSGPFEQTLLQVAPEHAFRGQTAGVNDADIDVANIVIESDLGWADLLATYSYIESSEEHSIPDGVFGRLTRPVSIATSTPHRENSGEIRLSTKLGGAWNFLTGIYADKQHDVYTSDWIWFGDPGANPFTPQLRDVFDYVDERDLRQKAAFAEVSWKFLPRVTLTGGARYYDYERSAHIDQSGALIGGGSTSTDTTTDATGTTFRANVSYKPTDDTLLYAGWSQGFRLGRPQPRVPAAACDTNADGLVDGTSYPIASTGDVDSDNVDSYEIGGKLTAFNNRIVFDAAVFRMDWSDLPVGVRGSTCAFGFQANAGAARSEGVELQAQYHVQDNFQIYVGGSLIDAKLTKDAPIQGFADGDRLPGSPEESANLGVQYSFDVAGHLVSLRVDSIYVGSFYSTLKPLPHQEAGDYVKVDASARVEIDNLSIDLFIRNLTDEDAFAQRANPTTSSAWGYRIRPRTVGVQLGYDF